MTLMRKIPTSRRTSKLARSDRFPPSPLAAPLHSTPSHRIAPPFALPPSYPSHLSTHSYQQAHSLPFFNSSNERAARSPFERVGAP